MSFILGSCGYILAMTVYTMCEEKKPHFGAFCAYIIGVIMMYLAIYINGGL